MKKLDISYCSMFSKVWWYAGYCNSSELYMQSLSIIDMICIWKYGVCWASNKVDIYAFLKIQFFKSFGKTVSDWQTSEVGWNERVVVASVPSYFKKHTTIGSI